MAATEHAATHSSGALEVVVVSPARPLFEGEATWIAVPGRDGELGILPRHAPLVAALGSGILRIGQAGGKVIRYAVWGGFVKVGHNKVTVLVDHAVTEDDVDAAVAQRELDETLVALKNPETDADFEELLDRRAWSVARLKLAGAKP